MRGILVVLKKEIRENLRDRKAVFNSLLLAPILFPVLLIGMTWLGTSAQTERAERVLEVPVVGAEQAPNLIRYLKQQGMHLSLPNIKQPEKASIRKVILTLIS